MHEKAFVDHVRARVKPGTVVSWPRIQDAEAQAEDDVMPDAIVHQLRTVTRPDVQTTDVRLGASHLSHESDRAVSKPFDRRFTLGSDRGVRGTFAAVKLALCGGAGAAGIFRPA